MPAQLEMQNDVIRRNHAREHRMRLIRREIPATLGRASVADAFRRDLLRLARLVRRHILEPHAHRRRRRIAITQLRGLDDHLLADIGLTRGQIELAVDGMLAPRGDTFSPPVGRSMPAEEAELPLAA
jgi:uncharacterized protein YjiS (DUF1127 family)